jgi:DNA-binding transcriptional MerR regulator
VSGDPAEGLTIGAVAARTGLSVPVLRAWEDRFGFPTPQRLPAGHRRYGEIDVEAIERVLAERASGRSLEAAISIARGEGARPPVEAGTVFAGLRAVRPEVPVNVLRRRGMLAMSRAIEEECLAVADRPRLAAAFQYVDRWQGATGRWGPLIERATDVTVFADFPRSRVRANGLTEIAIGRGTPLTREWSVLVESPRFTAVLAGWERPDGRFEALWTVDPSIVQTAFAIAEGLARTHAPSLPRPARRAVSAKSPSVRAARSITASAEAIASRALGYLAG